jgi:hypothetical protein
MLKASNDEFRTAGAPIRTVAVICAFLTSFTLQSHIVAQEQLSAGATINLTYRHEVKSVARYQVSMNYTVADVRVTSNRIFKQTVQEIKADGDVSLESRDVGGHVIIGGVDRDIPFGPHVTKTLSQFGMLVTYHQDNDEAFFLSPQTAKLMATLSSLLFPDRPVKGGETWQNQIPNPFVEGNLVTISTTFVGMEKLGESERAKLRQVATVTGAQTGEEPLKYDATGWVNPESGQLIKMEASVENVHTEFGMLNWVMSSNFIEDKAKK